VSTPGLTSIVELLRNAETKVVCHSLDRMNRNIRINSGYLHHPSTNQETYLLQKYDANTKNHSLKI